MRPEQTGGQAATAVHVWHSVLLEAEWNLLVCVQLDTSYCRSCQGTRAGGDVCCVCSLAVCSSQQPAAAVCVAEIAGPWTLVVWRSTGLWCGNGSCVAAWCCRVSASSPTAAAAQLGCHRLCKETHHFAAKHSWQATDSRKPMKVSSRQEGGRKPAAQLALLAAYSGLQFGLLFVGYAKQLHSGYALHFVWHVGP